MQNLAQLFLNVVYYEEGDLRGKKHDFLGFYNKLLKPITQMFRHNVLRTTNDAFQILGPDSGNLRHWHWDWHWDWHWVA